MPDPIIKAQPGKEPEAPAEQVSTAPSLASFTPEQIQAFLAFQEQQKAGNGPVKELTEEEKKQHEHEALVKKYGPDFVTTTKATDFNGSAMKSYWTKEAWEALYEDTNPKGEPLGTKGGHKKVLQIFPEAQGLPIPKRNG